MNAKCEHFSVVDGFVHIMCCVLRSYIIPYSFSPFHLAMKLDKYSS